MDTVARPAPAAIPTMSSALARRLPWTLVIAGLLVAVISVAVIEISGRSDWWRGFNAASLVAIGGAVVSMAILRQLADVRLDTAVTVVMLASGVRVAISLIGLIVAVKLFQSPADPTGFMICGYYAAMLIAETTLVVRATRGAGTNIGDRDA